MRWDEHQVAYDFETMGWEDWYYDQHSGLPDMVGDVQGMFVHVWDSDTGDEHYFWVYSYAPYQDWEQWDDLIESAMDQHGMSMA